MELQVTFWYCNRVDEKGVDRLIRLCYNGADYEGQVTLLKESEDCKES